MLTSGLVLLVTLSSTLISLSAPQVARTADTLITISTPKQLKLPTSHIPAGFSFGTDQAITQATLQPLIGQRVFTIFQKNGFKLGSHQWLTYTSGPGAPFATEDLFVFSTINGARTARAAYQGVLLGTPLPNRDSALPKSALIWKSTGTFGTNSNQVYTVVEIVFRVANVLGDSIGYYAGTGNQADALALQQARAITISYTQWLSTHLSSQTSKHAQSLSILRHTASSLPITSSTI